MPSFTHRPVAKTKKQLRFNPTVRGIFFECEAHKNWTRIWYTPEECRVLHKTLQTDIELLRSLRRTLTNHPHVPLSAADQAALEATTIQGIERLMSKKTFADRSQQQRAVIDAVLAEQQRQKVQGRSASSLGYDSDKLALVSSALSFETRHRALADGRRCADEVISEL